MTVHVAVDLGATSGRVVIADIDAAAGRFELDEVHRFAHEPTAAADGEDLFWDVEHIWQEIGVGLRSAEQHASRSGLSVASVGVDSWAIDYGLLDDDGQLLDGVHCYRSPRFDGVMEAVIAQHGRSVIYDATGIQFLPFNTVYQLVAQRHSPAHDTARRLLMLPDLVNHWLCGSTTVDVTNASTTQLLDPVLRQWHDGLVARLGLRRDLLPELHEPGTRLGTIRVDAPALAGVAVVAVGSHDTASAFAGTPLTRPETSLVLSCGTWGLLGVERAEAARGSAAMAANITNELGVAGTVRVLKNVTGLWLLEQCRRVWSGAGLDVPPDGFSAAARHVPAGRAVIDPDDPALAKPGDMPRLIQAACATRGQPVPVTPAETCRVVLDSLATAWRRAARDLSAVTGSTFERMHAVGGGSQNTLLMELAASALDMPVVVGPTEATVVGNVMVQAMAMGTIPDLTAGRELVTASMPGVTVAPCPILAHDGSSIWTP
ncbi:rhamnulokinase family protein [soil metagenome]